MLETGELKRLIDEDAVVGVTSNPTIFEKALVRPESWYDEQLRAELERSDDTEARCSSRSRSRTSRRACDLLRPVWERTDGVDGFVSLEVDPELAYDRERNVRAGDSDLHGAVDRPNLYVKIPATGRVLGAIEDSHRRRACRSTSRSSSRSSATPRSPRRTCAGLERLVAGRTAIRRTVISGRELLRLARRHRGRPAARGDRAAGSAGQARDREREARLRSTTSRSSPARAGMRSRRAGATAAALPVGVDLDEEPGVPRRALRRGADRPGHREHDAARDDRAPSGPLASVRGHARPRASTRPRSAARRARGGRRRLRRRRRRRSRREGVQKFSDSFDSPLLAGIDAKRAAPRSHESACALYTM